MKVKMLTAVFLNDGFAVSPRQIVDLDEEVAKKLIDVNFAVEIKDAENKLKKSTKALKKKNEVVE